MFKWACVSNMNEFMSSLHFISVRIKALFFIFFLGSKNNYRYPTKAKKIVFIFYYIESHMELKDKSEHKKFSLYKS